MPVDGSSGRMDSSRWLIHFGVFLGILVYAASQGQLEEAMTKILLEEVESAKGKYVTYPVNFVLYTNSKEDKKRIISTLTEPGKIHQGHFNRSAVIKILIHGWQHRLNKDFESNYQRAFTGTIRNVQVVAVRWKEADRDYIGARRAVPGVAHQVRKYVQRLYKDYGVHPRKLSFFGHGLGAQIAGAVGHLTRGRIGKIVAMDPSMPLFWQNTHDSVNMSSAMKVIGIHTSAATFGVIWNVGHVDFWSMNGMAPQTPCLKLETPEKQLRCSHEQAYKYFVETVKEKGSIVAETCGKKYVCKPHLFVRQKVMLTEFTRAKGQFCFVPPKWHPWPELKDILGDRNHTELPTYPPINESTTPLGPNGVSNGVSIGPLAPGETTISAPPGAPTASLAPGETRAPSRPGESTSPLPPGASSRLPPGAWSPLPPGASSPLPPGASSPLPPGASSPLPPGAFPMPPRPSLPPLPGASPPPSLTEDCDEMIRMHHALLHGSRGLYLKERVRMRALRAKIKKCEDLKTRMKRISNASWRRHRS